MKSSRRHFLAASALGLTACDRLVPLVNRELFDEGIPAKIPPPPAGAEIDPEFHLLSRASFGPWPGDVWRVKKMGRDAWLEEQLHPERVRDTACDLRAERFESLYFAAGDAYEWRKPVLRDEITRHTLLRAVYSRRQLFEVMVEFWTDHLNIDLEKGDCIHLKPSDDRDVIRRHALGNFYDLIRASALSPAMLVYLDGRSNKVRRNSDDKPNENYARELMELHTLGVRGGYTQRDVLEAARCLSGWTFDRGRFLALNQGESFFRPDWHDNGEKRVLGQVIPAGGGPKDVERLVDIVCSHPSTAKYIASKLCKRFISMEPPAGAVDKVAAEFTRTHGDIRCMLRVLFGTPEFAESRGRLLKRPFKFMVSALRALAADAHADKNLLEPLQRMGHGLFQHPTPDGYPDEELPWMGTLMWRWNFAVALAAGKQNGVRINLYDLRRQLHLSPSGWFPHLVGRAPTEAEQKSLKSQDEAGLVGLILASPAFQRC